ncbi:TNT domain-containing protein [Sphaerisporangium fuscum]|uniref:TNT domain-containing protein n=1 Tax=Sphaerisporangium fuscum TaxID=2835868 RepID=UPI001BDC17F7|nr:TNT domain-containing protein [Sphaerisporangium fuscum]
MRRIRRGALLIAAGAVVAVTPAGVPALAGTRPPAVQPAPEKAEAVCTAPFVENDPRLGPVNLPETGLLGRILRGYAQLGGLSGYQFIDRYWDLTTNSYRFPPDDGFAHAGGFPNAKPVLEGYNLEAGTEVDRFGGEGGAFLSPVGTPYSQRAIPPSNLDTFAPQYPCNYHVYRVARSFAVDVGPIAPAFQQPGGGRQYHLLSKYFVDAPKGRREASVAFLVEQGYLQRLN